MRKLAALHSRPDERARPRLASFVLAVSSGAAVAILAGIAGAGPYAAAALAFAAGFAISAGGQQARAGFGAQRA